MRNDKLDKYAPFEEEVGRQGITYAPATFTAFARSHPSTTKMLQTAAAKVARQQGLANGKSLVKHWRREVAAEIWRRAARMIRACLPPRLQRGDGHAQSADEDDSDEDGVEPAVT